MLRDNGSFNSELHGEVGAKTVSISCHSELFFKKPFLIWLVPFLKEYIILNLLNRMCFHVLIFLGGDVLKDRERLIVEVLRNIMGHFQVCYHQAFYNFIRRYLQFGPNYKGILDPLESWNFSKMVSMEIMTLPKEKKLCSEIGPFFWGRFCNI